MDLIRTFPSSPVSSDEVQTCSAARTRPAPVRSAELKLGADESAAASARQRLRRVTQRLYFCVRARGERTDCVSSHTRGSRLCVDVGVRTEDGVGTAVDERVRAAAEERIRRT